MPCLSPLSIPCRRSTEMRVRNLLVARLRDESPQASQQDPRTRRYAPRMALRPRLPGTRSVRKIGAAKPGAPVSLRIKAANRIYPLTYRERDASSLKIKTRSPSVSARWKKRPRPKPNARGAKSRKTPSQIKLSRSNRKSRQRLANLSRRLSCSSAWKQPVGGSCSRRVSTNLVMFNRGGT